MPGTRTAPDLTTAASYKKVRYAAIDANGDFQSNSIIVASAATQAAIETFIAEGQERSNASWYEVGVESVWSGERLKGNALSDVYLQIEDQILYSIKAGVNTSQYIYLPSPLETMIVAGSDKPDVAALSDWFASVLAIATGYTGRQVSFTRHKETNNDNKERF